MMQSKLNSISQLIRLNIAHSNLNFARNVSNTISYKTSNANARSIDELPTTKKLLGLIDLELVRCPPTQLHELFNNRTDKLGSMWVLQPFAGSSKIVFISSPDLIQQYYENEGKYPARSSVTFYPGITAKEYLNIDLGIVLSSGNENWLKYRQPFNNYLFKPRVLEAFIPKLSEIAERSAHEIISHSITYNDQTKFEDQLYIWALQSVYYVVTHEEIKDISNPENYRFVKEIDNIISKVNSYKPAIISPKLYHSKYIKSLISSFKYTANFVKQNLGFFHESSSSIVTGSDKFLEYLRNSSTLDSGEILSAILDVITAGVTTTQIATSWFWHNLAKNPHVQDKLHQEIESVIGNDQIVTTEHYNKLKYMKLCLKESARITAQILGNSRIASQDVLIGDTRIPKGTSLIFLTKTQTDEKNYKDADKFIPERWETREGRHPYAYHPFGIGARMCVGKRLAEIEINLITAQILRKATIKLKKEPIISNELILKPKGLELSFDAI